MSVDILAGDFSELKSLKIQDKKTVFKDDVFDLWDDVDLRSGGLFYP